MRNVRLILHLYWHYLTCIRGMLFFVLTGVLFLSFGFLSLLSSTGTHQGAFGFFIISLFMLIVFPFVTAGAVFRQLGANSQFALTGNALVLAFITLFLFTLLVTLSPWILLSSFGKDITAGQIIWIFFGASLHLFITQLSLQRQAMQGYQFLPILAIIFLPEIDVEKWYFLFVPSVTAPLVLITVCGWIWGFRKTVSTNRLAPNSFCSSLNLNAVDREALSRNALSRWLQAKTSSHASASLFYNMLVNNRVLVARQALFIIALPFLMALAMVALSWNHDHDRLNILRLTLLISLFVAIMAPFNMTEIMPRSKLLWLRTGSSRSDIWRIVEGCIALELACTLFLSVLLAIAGYFSGAVSLTETSAYLAMVFCCSPFFAYFPLFFRLDTDLTGNVILITGLVTVSIALFIVIFYAASENTPGPVFILSLMILALGLSFRFAARQSFHHVDWMKVKPRRLKPGSKA